MRPSFSIPSILAVIAAIMSFASGAIWGFILAVAAIVLGLLGIVLSISPRRRGGMLSIASVFAGAIGIVAALIKLIGAVVS